MTPAPRRSAGYGRGMEQHLTLTSACNTCAAAWRRVWGAHARTTRTPCRADSLPCERAATHAQAFSVLQARSLRLGPGRRGACLAAGRTPASADSLWVVLKLVEPKQAGAPWRRSGCCGAPHARRRRRRPHRCAPARAPAAARRPRRSAVAPAEDVGSTSVGPSMAWHRKSAASAQRFTRRL